MQQYPSVVLLLSLSRSCSQLQMTITGHERTPGTRSGPVRTWREKVRERETVCVCLVCVRAHVCVKEREKPLKLWTDYVCERGTIDVCETLSVQECVYCVCGSGKWVCLNKHAGL